jgi:hypothetical protein
MPGVDEEVPDTDVTTVEWPSDFSGWDWTDAVFLLQSVDDAAIDAWVKNVDKKYEKFIPTDYVMCGEIHHNPKGTDFEFGIGLQHESWSEGILAYMDTISGKPEFSTYFYDAEKLATAKLDARPDFLNGTPSTDPEGSGNTWG